jgi:hypothetical protein
VQEEIPLARKDHPMMCQCGHPKGCHLSEKSGGWDHPKGPLLAGMCLGDGPVPREPKDIHPCGCEGFVEA